MRSRRFSDEHVISRPISHEARLPLLTHVDELRTRLSALHPYELPELLAIDVAGGNERYLDWVRMGVRNKGEQ